jgi:hypothetical protein
MEKAIIIREYKGYTISYLDGIFSAKKGKIKFHFSSSDEDSLKSSLDDLEKDKEKNLQLIKEQKENLKKQKELEKKNKKLLSVRLIVSAKELKDFFKFSSLYACEAPIKIKIDRLEITQMDPANVCLFSRNVKFKKSQRLKEEYLMWFNLNHISNILKKVKFKKDDDLEISFGIKDHNTNTMKMKLKDYLFCFDSIGDDESKVKVPVLTFKSSFEIRSPDFYDLTKIAYEIYDSVEFNAKKKIINIVMKDKENDNTELIRYIESDKNVNENKAIYSTAYLNKKFFKNSKLKLEFSYDYPLKISDEKGNWLILAPRTEN